MKKKISACILATVITTSAFYGCGSTVTEQEQSSEIETEISDADEAITEDDSLSELEAVGDVEVDKGIFDVTLTIPKDFIGDTTQEEQDEIVNEKGYKSAVLNSDGSVTYVMTKAQHSEMLEDMRETIDTSLAEMAGSSDYPNITSVTANDDYTSFTITTKNTEPDLAESFAVMGLYMYGGLYGIFAGERVDNVHVDFVNADSGEIISSADSKNMDAEE